MAKKLFGTDGIRGRAGDYPLDDATVYAAGIALAEHLAKTKKPSVLIGMDTRESSEPIARTLAAGLAQGGVEFHFAGVTTTPGVAHATERGAFSAGVMISASHNPYHDNGIKVFGPFGYKMPDEQEAELEDRILALLAGGVNPTKADLSADPEIVAMYFRHLMNVCDFPAGGPKLQMIVDCANGAAAAIAPRVFEAIGANAEFIGDSPNGRNINLDCGSLHMDLLAEAVVARGADLGIAFDGDADRCLFVDEQGKYVDGDNLLLLAASSLKSRQQLHEDIVVATVMSNMGLEKALEREGIKMTRTKVGDKYVLEEMLRCGAALGGEQSGHVIFGDHATTGDGLLTALMLLRILTEEGQPLSALRRRLKVFPQKLVNVPVKEKTPFEKVPALRQAVAESERDLAGAGRVVVRYSGTEPLVRVMVEAEQAEDVVRHCAKLAELFEKHLGA